MSDAFLIKFDWRFTETPDKVILDLAFLELRAVIDYAPAAKIAFTDDFAFLSHGGRAAHRACDRVVGVLDLSGLGLILARLVQLDES